MKALALMVFKIFADKVKVPKFTKGNNSCIAFHNFISKLIRSSTPYYQYIYLV